MLLKFEHALTLGLTYFGTILDDPGAHGDLEIASPSVLETMSPQTCNIETVCMFMRVQTHEEILQCSSKCVACEHER